MKCNRFKIFLLSACTMFAFGCGDSGDSGNDKAQPGKTNEQPGDIVSVQNRTVSGVSQKGPFVTGSTVTVQELNGESLLQTGISFKGKISNDKGEFKVASINLASQYAFLEVNGYYRNEVTGSNSTSPIIMNALADISDRENVNINLLTHLETDRVMHLVTVDGKSFGEAKNQARKELLGYFGIDGNLGAAEDMSIFGQSDDSAALLAISIIVQGNLRESEFTERLARISGDIADGTINNQDIWNQMATWAVTADLQQIRLNMENWGEEVPDFEKYVKSFWRESLGLSSCAKIGAMVKYGDNVLICRDDGYDYTTDKEKILTLLGIASPSDCNAGENVKMIDRGDVDKDSTVFYAFLNVTNNMSSSSDSSSGSQFEPTLTENNTLFIDRVTITCKEIDNKADACNSHLKSNINLHDTIKAGFSELVGIPIPIGDWPFTEMLKIEIQANYHDTGIFKDKSNIIEFVINRRNDSDISFFKYEEKMDCTLSSTNICAIYGQGNPADTNQFNCE